MKCVNPRKLRNKGATGFDDAYIVASCGRCYACLSNRRRLWLFRLKNEQMSKDYSVFVTLTYDDDCCDGHLHKQHLQKFFKKLRKTGLSFTYYSIGEFGTTTFRPHYHAILFFDGIDKSQLYFLRDLIDKKWTYGFSSTSKCSYRRLNYVLHYHVRPKKPFNDDRCTFCLMSKGLGLGFLTDDLINYMVRTKNTTTRDCNGNFVVIPRYYRKKLIEMGYDIDGPKIFDSNYTRDRIQAVFGCDADDVPLSEQKRYLLDLWLQSERKMFKYNIQDKFQ